MGVDMRVDIGSKHKGAIQGNTWLQLIKLSHALNIF